jgi:TonB-like protein
MYRRLLLPLAAAGLLAAPPLQAQDDASGRQPTSCRRERARPPRRRPAEVARDSIRKEIRDAIRQDAREAARAAGVAEPTGMLILVVEDHEAGEGEARHYRSNVSETVRAGVLARAMPRLAEWPRERGPILINFRLDSADVPQPAEGRVVECRPTLANRFAIQRLVQEFADRHPFLTRPVVGDRHSALVKMLLTREGEVAYAMLDRESHDDRLDDFALELVPKMLFTPASVEGKLVDVWITLPINLQVPPEENRRPGFRQ